MTAMPRWRRTLTALAALVLLMTACLGGGDDGDGSAGGTEGDGDLSGQEVTILGAFVDPADDAFREAVSGFEEETGATVSYEGSADFETLIQTRVQGGNPPDIAMFPQPGLLANFVEQGSLQPLDEVLDPEVIQRLQENLVAGIYDLGTVDGTYYGLPRVLSVKSVVWYPPPEFEEAGYEIPESWEELLALTEEIAQGAEGPAVPWCIGIEASGSTGWVVTDWIEDLMLRTAGPEAYDRWIAGELEFSSPEVTRAAELFAEIAFNEDYVLGGTQGIITTPFGDAILPVVEDPPACFLHRQASFIIGFLPDSAVPGEDVDIFYFPPVEDGYDGRPVLSGGDLAGLFTDNPAAIALMEYMSDPSWLGPQIDTGSDFAPFADFPLEDYPNEIARAEAELLANADVVRFDASDSMPGAVGAGAFWTEMTAWVNGQKSLEDALAAIDEAWPAQ